MQQFPDGRGLSCAGVHLYLGRNKGEPRAEVSEQAPRRGPGVAEFCCQSWFQQQQRAQEGGGGLGAIQRAAGSTAFLKSALAASSNPSAHIFGLT